MSRPVDHPEHLATSPATVLDRVRPTVVRRRVYEPQPQAHAAPGAAHVMLGDSADDDENGPPSSVNVARALASLRGDELRRLDEIVSADDDPPVPSVRAMPVASAVPTLRMGPSMGLPELASSMGITDEELVTALVTHGFFSVTTTSVLTRETGRAAAAIFGWAVIDDDALVPGTRAKKPTKQGAPSSAKPSSAKSSAKPSSAKPSAKPAPKSKPASAAKLKPAAAKRTGRRGG